MSTKKRPAWVDRFLEKFKNPSSWVVVLLYASTLVICPLAVATIIIGYGHGVFAVITYTLCSLLFIYTMYVAINSFNRMKAKFHAKTDKIEFMRKLHLNPSFRTIIFAIFTIAINVAYAIFLIKMARKMNSSWYAALAMHSIVLFVARAGVLIKNALDSRRYKCDPVRLKKGKLNNYLFSGVMLLFLTIVLSAFVFVCVTVGGGMRVPRWAIYLFAIVAIHRIAMAIIHFIKAHRYEDLVARSVRYTNLATAFVSVLTLQASIMASFPPTFNPRPFTLLLSALVGLVGILLGTLMVLYACREKKRIRLAEKEMPQVAEHVDGYNREDYIYEYGKAEQDKKTK